MSDPYAHKCCKMLGVKSEAKHYKYKKPGNPFKIYPNLLMAEMQIDRPLQCVVSDMTAFYVKGTYYELTLYMDLWNNDLSSRRGDQMTYLSGLNELIRLKKQYPQYEMVLHSDQGVVYASKAFNELLPMYSITRSMSRSGTPTKMRRWSPSTDGLKQKSSWIFTSPEKAPLSRKWRPTSHISTQHGPHIR